LGIAATFDLTGTTVYRTMRPVLPPSAPHGADQDPFAAALSTIMAARPQAAERLHDESGETLADDIPHQARQL
jgi:hypothetical protein